MRVPMHQLLQNCASCNVFVQYINLKKLRPKAFCSHTTMLPVILPQGYIFLLANANDPNSRSDLW